MSKKKKKPVKNSDPAPKVQPVKISAKAKNNQWLIIAGILLITLICFFPALNTKHHNDKSGAIGKEFTNWDDPVYIVDLSDHAKPKPQPLITSTSFENIKKIFSISSPVSLNYHPLTMLSLAINYSFSGIDPFGYFFTNILFHLLNTLLVFIFLYRLSGKKFWVGAISALLFGIHPMHVESVAWAAERKDVLYCFFFLASCILYLSYIETKKIKYFIYCFSLFLLSCLSKAMAVPLPLVLILIDFYLQRKFTIKTIAEKIPFFILALLIGYLAVHIQNKEAIADFKVFTLPQRFMFAAYGFMMYWGKLFIPVKLSAFYPYPALDNNEVPLLYQISPFIAFAIVAVPLFIAYKMNKEKFRLLLFGMGFFVVMIALVLQFISVGAAIMADRYSYLPYIGAFFIIATFVNSFLEEKKTRQTAALIIGSVSLVFAVGCFNRVQVWKNSETLWRDVIEKYPYKIEQTGNVVKVVEVGVDNAYKNLGNFYRERGMPGDMDSAFTLYDVMVRAHTKDVGAYTNMGNFYGLKGQEAGAKGNGQLANQMFTKALEMYSEAIKLKPDNFETVMNRGITFSMMGDHTKALDDFNSALKINPAAVNLYANTAYEKMQLGNYAESINDCNNALSANPNDANSLFYRGTDYVNAGKFNEAINDLVLATKINPSYSNAWYNLSVAYGKAGNKPAALDAALNAKKNGYAVTDAYLNGLK